MATQELLLQTNTCPAFYSYRSTHLSLPQEEVSHCAVGTKWLTYLFDQARQHGPSQSAAAADSALDPQNFPDVQAWFHALVRQHFRGDLKVRIVLCCKFRSLLKFFERSDKYIPISLMQPPFNEVARKAAGFDERWWQPLMVSAAKSET